METERKYFFHFYLFDVFKDDHACLVGASITETFKYLKIDQTTFRQKLLEALNATRGGSVAWLSLKGYDVRIRYDWERADVTGESIEIYDEDGNVINVVGSLRALECREKLAPGNGDSWLRAMNQNPDLLCNGHYYIKY